MYLPPHSQRLLSLLQSYSATLLQCCVINAIRFMVSPWFRRFFFHKPIFFSNNSRHAATACASPLLHGRVVEYFRTEISHHSRTLKVVSIFKIQPALAGENAGCCQLVKYGCYMLQFPEPCVLFLLQVQMVSIISLVGLLTCSISISTASASVLMKLICMMVTVSNAIFLCFRRCVGFCWLLECTNCQPSFCFLPRVVHTHQVPCTPFPILILCQGNQEKSLISFCFWWIASAVVSSLWTGIEVSAHVRLNISPVHTRSNGQPGQLSASLPSSHKPWMIQRVSKFIAIISKPGQAAKTLRSSPGRLCDLCPVMATRLGVGHIDNISP